MANRLAAGLIGLWCMAAAARDPFAPLTVAHCRQKMPDISQWRLQGIIGRAGDFHSWLLSPQGRPVRVTQESVFPIDPWQVSEITPLTLHVHAGQHCGQQQFSWRLQGRLYEKDDDRTAVAAEPGGLQP